MPELLGFKQIYLFILRWLFTCSNLYVINRMPTKLLHNRTPYELLFHKSPSYYHLKVFGCLCYVFTLTHNRDKFWRRATKCIFLRYPFGQKGYKVMDLTTKKLLFPKMSFFMKTSFHIPQILIILSFSNNSFFFPPRLHQYTIQMFPLLITLITYHHVQVLFYLKLCLLILFLLLSQSSQNLFSFLTTASLSLSTIMHRS